MAYNLLAQAQKALTGYDQSESPSSTLPVGIYSGVVNDVTVREYSGSELLTKYDQDGSIIGEEEAAIITVSFQITSRLSDEDGRGVGWEQQKRYRFSESTKEKKISEQIQELSHFFRHFTGQDLPIEAFGNMQYLGQALAKALTNHVVKVESKSMSEGRTYNVLSTFNDSEESTPTEAFQNTPEPETVVAPAPEQVAAPPAVVEPEEVLVTENEPEEPEDSFDVSQFLGI